MQICVCDTFSSGSTQWVFKFFLHGDILPYVPKSDSDNLENCICCIDNWVNEINLNQKWNIWHFNEGGITFCALNDAP